MEDPKDPSVKDEILKTFTRLATENNIQRLDEEYLQRYLVGHQFDIYSALKAGDRRIVRRQKGERKSDGKRTKSDERRTNDDGRRTVRRQNDDDRRTVRRQNDDDRRTVGRQKGERKSDGWRTNGGDRRTVRRQKGERNSDGRRTNDDDKRTVRRRRGVIRKFVSPNKLNAFSGRIDGVEQQIDQVGQKVNRIEKEFQENREEIERRLERKLEDTKRQVQKEILEKIEGLEHQLHRTSITDSGDCSTSPATPLQNSTLMHAERSVHKMLKPPTNDGQSSWSMYRRQFEAAAKANGWTPQEMATSLVISLRGQALEILQSIPEEQQNDYDRIVGALEIRYGHKYLRQVYQSQIKSRQQRTNESLQEYEADIERLIHLAYPQAPKEFLEQIGIQTFIDGLLDTEMQQALRLGRHTTISDVLVAALEFKAAKEASRNYKPKIASESFGKPQLVDTEGRVSTTCTQCPKISVSKISSDERSLVIHGYLDDKWCSFIIDTGATRTILRPNILPKPPKELPRHVKLETATGEQIPVHGELNVKIQLGSKIMYHRVLTADIRDDCILGLDILSKHGFVVDIKNRIIQIQNEEIVMAPKLQDYNQSRRIIIEEDIQIPQGSENIVIARLDGNGEGLSTGIVEARERNDGLLVARSLVQINNQIPVRIANISNKKIILKKNEVLGRCEPVVKIVKCEEVNQARTNQARVRDPTIAEPLLKNAAHLEPEENPEGQVARWMERLQQYDFKIKHRSGKTHGNADTLSRRPCLEQKCRYCQKIETKESSYETCNELLMATTIEVEDEWSSEELKKSQKKDSDLKLIRNWLKNGVRPTWQEVSRYGTTIKGYWAQWNSLCLRDGLLHRKWESPDGVSAVYQLVLPKARIHQVLEELHNSPSGGHFGVTRTLARVRDRFYWVKLSPRRRRMVQEMDWDKLVPLFLLSYRSSQHESTTYTPSMLTSGREMKLPTDLILGHPLEENQERSLPEFVENLRERLNRIHRFASEKLKMHSDKMKQRLVTTSTETAFEPGDAVWLYAPKRTKGKSNWEGPYTIIKKINDLVYRIQLSPRSKPKVVHLERLARYTGHNPPDWFVVEDPPPRTEDSVIRDE
ncbi:hypothetical protein NQ318_002770 [Aromia moschata]|uniref:RNA-directed DNA polymerase n=1 Tax=Aromia moschata TaxID=1265417 RepID=A0AAV8X4Z1_9CUCU|nr:hypothetical protein NQ318_002770 [Aromia moschata]